MGTARPFHGSRRARIAAAGAAAFLAAFLTACGNNSDDTAGTSTGATSGASSALAAEVDTLTKPLSAYPVPTTPVDNASSLSGKTVYYIPITQQSPQFAVTGKTLTAAMSAVGIHVQICDGKGTPTDVSACVNQATQAKAGAIITDAIPYGLGSNAFDAAQSANIPVIISNQIPDASHPASKTLAYIPAGGSAMEEALAKWITLDSGASAHVLINQNADGPSPAAFVAAGQTVYASACPKCKITINQVSSANFSLVPSSTSAQLLRDPNIDYLESQFEQFLQATQTGLKQTSRTDVKVVTGAAQLSGLQAVKSGSIDAAAAQASAFQGWVDTDAALRLMLGQELPTYTIPVRLFTRDTIGSVPLTSQAEESGEWFGPTTFTTDFKKLWGLS